MAASAALPYFEIAVAVAVLLGAVHSVYRGTLGEMIDNIRRIPNVEKKVGEVEDKQEDMSDAIVLIGHAATTDGIEPDPKALERDLRDEDKGPSRYARDDFYRGGGTSEDEEEATEPTHHRKPEVSEPE